MVGINGGLEVDADFYSFSIIDDEPIFIFEAGIGYDVVATYSQIKKDYKIVEAGDNVIRGYLIRDYVNENDIKHILGVKCPIVIKDVNYYDIHNYSLIVKYGYDEDSIRKARKWFKNQIDKEYADKNALIAGNWFNVYKTFKA